MAYEEDYRVFVGGLSWDTTDRSLENAFRRFGKVLDAKIVLDRDTGRPRGFGFVTFADERGMKDAISELHNRDLDGRVISVNKAEPKSKGGGYGYDDGGYSNGGGRRGGYGGRGGGGSGGSAAAGGRDDCFKCGQSGHWARDCPSGGGGRYSSRDRDRSGGRGGRSDLYGGGGGGGGGSGYSGRYGDKEQDWDHYGRDRYGPSDRYADGYKESRSGGYSDRDRYGSGGPTRYESSYRSRPTPYERPGGSRASYDDRY